MKTSKIFKVHIFVRVIISSILIFLSGGIVFGFPALKPGLLDSGLYSWLCVNNNLTTINQTHDMIKNQSNICPEQILRTNLLYQTMTTFSLFSAFLNGIIIGKIIIFNTKDMFGRKTLSFLSGILWVVFSILFCVSSQSFDMYIPSFAALGMAGGAQWYFQN
jgi:MFS family permease